jgi:aspartate/methionine/tyrosine aminotransferase
MNNQFPQMAMSKFSNQFTGLKLTAMHATNPEPFTQSELERVIGLTFNEILQEVSLGFCADEGSESLRNSVARNLYMSCQASDVITHAGAQEALFCAFQALLTVGDKVLVVAPVFMPLVEVPLDMGCQVSYIFLDPKNQWKLDLNQLELEFKMGCKLFVINYPNNPTGAMLTDGELNSVIDLCRKYHVWLLSDEVFRGLEHDPTGQLACVADIYERGLSIGVISKAFAIPGIRVAWLVCKNQQLRNRVLEVKSYLSICNSQVDEALATKILEKSNHVLKRNIDLILSNKTKLEKLDNLIGDELSIIIPQAGCCAFALLNTDSEKWAQKLALTKNYLMYPSSLFKAQQHGVRLGFGYKNFTSMIEHLYDR